MKRGLRERRQRRGHRRRSVLKGCAAHNLTAVHAKNAPEFSEGRRLVEIGAVAEKEAL